MSKLVRSVTRLLIGSSVAVLFVAVTIGARGQSTGQSLQGPSEKNMFIETPAGWKTPKTVWGDPDLQGTWPISYVGSVPLERCAGGSGRAGGTPAPCDLEKAFLTEDEFKA